MSKDVRDCYRHVEYCARMAQIHSDERTRQEFLDLKRRWLRLAQSYEFAARLETSTKSLGT
jgi:hypothetical protein